MVIELSAFGLATLPAVGGALQSSKAPTLALLDPVPGLPTDSY